MGNKGSSIIWVVSALMIFMILVAGIFVLVGGTHRSAMADNYKQQAYYAAVSAVEAVAQYIFDDGNMAPVTLGPGGKKDYVVSFSLDMGDASSVTAIRSESGSGQQIKIEATGTYKGATDHASLYLYGKPDEEVSASGIYYWVIWKYDK